MAVGDGVCVGVGVRVTVAVAVSVVAGRSSARHHTSDPANT